MKLYENERCDKVNDNLSLIQKSDGLLFGTDALLLAAYVSSSYKLGIELGGGTGIISMLLLSREKLGKCISVEAQEEYADLISRNAILNSLNDRLISVHSDIRDYEPDTACELVFSNPPYMKTDSGKENQKDKKNIARHEVKGDINDFAKAAAKYLKFGGTFAVVYRPDRLTDLLFALRSNRLEPKRMTFVHADTEAEPSMLLVEAKSGGKPGARLTRPLFIYKDSTHTSYTAQMEYILENGSFPENYKIR